MESLAFTTNQQSAGDTETGAPNRRLALLALAGLTVVFLISFLLTPSSGEYFTICGFKNVTGLPCPGCGLTHSFCALTKGGVGEAFKFNLLGPPLYAVFVLLWVRSAVVLLKKDRAARVIDRFTERLKLVRTLAYGFAIYGSARIIYLLIFQPLVLNDSPLSRLFARLIH
jgi:hypothetical protein